jgi:hypothetical protein
MKKLKKMLTGMFLKVKFKILRKLNDDEPSTREVAWALDAYRGHTPKIRQAMLTYALLSGGSLEYVGMVMNHTRERVRQMIRKGVVQSWAKYN